MVRSETPEPSGADQSLGDLVALAAKDVSQLLRYEIDLAKVELRGDLRRVGLAGALGVVAAFVGCLILVLLCIAFAYGLVALGVWRWAAFLIVAGTCVLLAGVAVGIAFLKLRHLSGLRQTRKSVTEGIGLLRRDGQHPAVAGDKHPAVAGDKHPAVAGDKHPAVAGDSAPEITPDGQHPEIAARKSR